MSEGGGEALGPPFTTTGGFQSSQPVTPSSTIPDAGADLNSKSTSSSGLPPFSSFTATELAAEGLGSRLGPEGFGTETYPGRILDFPSWSYYDEGLTGRLLDRGDGLPMLIPQPQYRPWENKPMEAITQDGFTKTYDYPGSPASKLPSFQSQFNAFPPEQNGETISLTTLTPAPPSPTTNNSGLPSFHTLSTVTVNPRGYPLVPAPVQAREIPHIQQQFLEERHIQLFQSPPTLNNAQYHQLGLTSTNPTGIIQGNFVTHPQTSQQATLLTVVKTEPVAIVTAQLHQQPHIYQNSSTILEHESVKVEESASSPRGLQDSRKKERRKIRASSMESSIESDGVGSSSVESSGQVAAISSTAGFKSPLMQHQNIGSLAGNVSVSGQHGDTEECENGTGEKQTKKKRKRCGECIGCQRKDNCGECAPCRNDKSHQICKMRRCEKLTDKKVS
ncbi:hypothetical protein PGB90_008409 [Kerria lacca]